MMVDLHLFRNAPICKICIPKTDRFTILLSPAEERGLDRSKRVMTLAVSDETANGIVGKSREV